VAPSVAPPNLTSAANTTSDSISDTKASSNSPATSQELSKFPRITGVRHWSSADSTTVVLDLEDQVQYEAHRLTGPDRIGKSIEVSEPLVSRIRMAQPVAGMTRVVLDTKANSTFSVSLEPNP